jgi:hypothetical protein
MKPILWRRRGVGFAVAVLAIVVSCKTSPKHSADGLGLEALLGTDEVELRARMAASGAIDVTAMTDLEYAIAAFGDQKYLWYEMPDRSVAVVLFHGKRVEELRVVVVEISSPELGLEGIKRFRANVARRASLID